MIKRFYKYSCPSCGSKKFKAPAGFLNQVTACSDKCKSTLKIKAEYQFHIWGFTNKQLNNMFWKSCAFLELLDIDRRKLLYTDFICWLYLKHGYSKIELVRVYSGIMEK